MLDSVLGDSCRETVVWTKPAVQAVLAVAVLVFHAVVWQVHSVRCGRDTEAAFGETVLESLWLDPGATVMDPQLETISGKNIRLCLI